MPKRAASVVLAAALAITMMPANAIAYGAEAASTSSDAAQASSASDVQAASSSADAQRPGDVVSQDHPIESASSASESAASSASSAAASSIVAATVAVEQPAADGEASDNDRSGDNDGVDIVSASVQLGAPATIVTCSGLQFAVDEAARTATLVGIGSTALAGQLVVPAEITIGNASYSVTNISAKNAAGGGF